MTARDLSVEKTKSGYLRVYAIIDGTFREKLYLYYSVREARQRFYDEFLA